MRSRANAPAGRTKILIVDDELAAREAFRTLFEQSGYEVAVAEDGAEALARFTEFAADVVVTDLNMPVMGGLELLRALRLLGSDVPIIVCTACGDLTSAVVAMRAGADDYLVEPIELEALLITVNRAVEQIALRRETVQLRSEIRERDGEGLHGLIGTSAAMQKVYRAARQAGAVRATVMILGERGTGKSVLASAIHALGPRASQPFIALDCAALADALEDELFGEDGESPHRRASGIEQASGGTLFLEDIGEMPMATQTRLLWALREKTFERGHGSEAVGLDVRLVAASSRNLTNDVHEGRFRADLLCQLTIVALEMPPLRAREGDVVRLGDHFLRKLVEENHAPISGFTDEAHTKLLAHPWPGNVRHLKYVVESAFGRCRTSTVGASDVHFGESPTSSDAAPTLERQWR